MYPPFFVIIEGFVFRLTTSLINAVFLPFVMKEHYCQSIRALSSMRKFSLHKTLNEPPFGTVTVSGHCPRPLIGKWPWFPKKTFCHSHRDSLWRGHRENCQLKCPKTHISKSSLSPTFGPTSVPPRSLRPLLAKQPLYPRFCPDLPTGLSSAY